ncbi:MAG: NAAT family transporter [Propionibacteriaceae bacterium]|jgi:multiple antibiotic resistance protein|nr:NAAT family transporter [Propionibacteriaceae bacterium]
MAQYLSATLLLFLVIDPLGNIPLFLTATKQLPNNRRQRVIARELLIALVIMVLFFFIGGWFLDALHITQPAMAVGGGMILMLIAIKMVFPGQDSTLGQDPTDEPFIVPMAVPYMAGPSVLATEVILVHQTPDHWLILLAALISAWLVGSVILYCSGLLQRLLGDKAVTAIERLMGMILVLISAQMLLGGIKEFFAL